MTSMDDSVGNEKTVAPAFDVARVVVIGTDGVIARYPGIVAVFAAAIGEDDEQLNQFLSICEQASLTGAGAPGKRLARQLSLWLASMDESPCLGTVATTGAGVAIFLAGPAKVEFGDGSPSLSGADSAAWLDRVIDAPTSQFTLGVGAELWGADPGVLNLQAGVVTGSSATIVPSAAMSAISTTEPAVEPTVEPVLAESVVVEPVVVEPVLAESVVVEPVVVEPVMAQPVMAEPVIAPPVMAEPVIAQPISAPPAEPVLAEPPMPAPEALTVAPRAQLRPPARSALLTAGGHSEPTRAPLPVPGVTGPEAGAGASSDTPQVQGFLCSRGHLNDPRALFCGLCGIRMAERTGILTIGRRPPLGLLVFDDGATFTVDSGYVLGRDPESDERVRQGELRPLVVIDTRGAVSRRHALIQLDGWHVLVGDAGSANGTFIAERGSMEWSALAPQQMVQLQAGTRIRIGTRTFVFESPNGGP
jgi:hypothetical protein